MTTQHLLCSNRMAVALFLLTAGMVGHPCVAQCNDLSYKEDTGRGRHAQLRKSSEEIRDVLSGALEPEELAIVQKALDRIAEAFTT